MTTSVQRRPRRGLADLRTLGGGADGRISPHKAYLRISFLELERARRMQEARTCHDRVEAIHARFSEIDAEIAAIRASLDSPAPRAQALRQPPRSSVGRRPASGRFHFAY